MLVIPRRLPNSSKETQGKCTSLAGAHEWHRGWSSNIGHCEHKSLSLQTALLEARAVLNGHLRQSRSNDRINTISFISLLCLPHAKNEVVYSAAHYLRLDLSFMSLYFYIRVGGEGRIFHSRSTKCVPPYNVIRFLRNQEQFFRSCSLGFKSWSML
jgi:hypothetical protein